MSDQIARELLERSDANLKSALLLACHLLENARMRVEDCLPDKGMGVHDLALLWRDLHPHKAAPAIPKEPRND